jgi:hypothetical protein
MPSTTVDAALAWLDDQWRMPTRLSTVPQALAALGVGEADPVRWQVTSRLARDWRKRLFDARADAWIDHPERLDGFAKQLRTWRFASISLTTAERVIASAIARPAASIIDPAALAEGSSMPAAAVDAALDALRRVGMLDADGASLRPLRTFERQLSGLGLSFHVVTLEKTGDTFNTTCAIDYVVLAKNVYPGQRLRLHDACAHTMEPLDVVFDSNGVISGGDGGPVLYRGGPCGRNLLFRSEDDLEAWLGAPPAGGKAARLGAWLERWGVSPVDAGSRRA